MGCGVVGSQNPLSIQGFARIMSEEGLFNPGALGLIEWLRRSEDGLPSVLCSPATSTCTPLFAFPEIQGAARVVCISLTTPCAHNGNQKKAREENTSRQELFKLKCLMAGSISLLYVVRMHFSFETKLIDVVLY